MRSAQHKLRSRVCACDGAVPYSRACRRAPARRSLRFLHVGFCPSRSAGSARPVDLLAERLKRSGRKYRLHRQAKVFADLERELEAWPVIAALQKPDGLVVHADCVRQLLTADAPLGAQHRYAVKEPALPGSRRPRFVILHSFILRLHNKLVNRKIYAPQSSAFEVESYASKSSSTGSISGTSHLSSAMCAGWIEYASVAALSVNFIIPAKVYPCPRGERLAPTCASSSPGMTPRKARISFSARALSASVASAFQRNPKM